MDRVSRERLLNIVRRFSQRKILVIGDSVADQFVYGAISRVSREAPVFILRHEQTETLPGGAANCAINIAALGAQVTLISVAGTDEPGKSMVEKLTQAGVDCSEILKVPGFRTTTKVRILAGQVHSTRQQVIRLDYEGSSVDEKELKEQLHQRIVERASGFDAVIISDYNYGVADAQTARVVRETTHSRGVPVLVDSRFRLSSFEGFTSATPNEDEVEQLVGEPISQTDQLESAGSRIRSQHGYQALLITRGGKGMLLIEDGISPLQIDAVGGREPVDVTGAGDTVIATYTLALASEASFPEAAILANHAGGLVVMKRGTAAVTTGELENSLQSLE
ncbi:MAG TPA: PfkB family carbohydrate kinase [Pyrinomonadaceae bacterium]|nr:PfkB family carbohydrate kinase [Pyrinomonadaceae bacterium]